MNKIQKGIAVIALLVLPVVESQAQIVVRIRPPRPKVVVTARPVQPSPRHIWVEEDWVVRNKRYYWHGGYWAAPPRVRAVWVPGHWKHTRRGDVWVPGGWR